jgi:hypothetical protein
MAKNRKAASIRTVIKNYGLMWRRDGVFWGRGSNRGILEGRRSGKIVDFREQIGVYVLYDEARRPVYVGQAGQGRGKARLFSRLRNHRRDGLAHRWQYFSWFGLLTVNKTGALSGWDAPSKRVSGTMTSTLNEIEGVLIAATEPAFNKQGARFRGIARYRQVIHKDAEPISPTQLREILSDISEKLDGLSAVARPPS